MKFAEAVIGFDKNTDRVEVGPCHDGPGWSDNFDVAIQTRRPEDHRFTNWILTVAMLDRFHEVVVSGGVDPQAVHRAMLGIEEYRAWCQPDTAAPANLSQTHAAS